MILTVGIVIESWKPYVYFTSMHASHMAIPRIILFNICWLYHYPRADGAKRRARVLIPPPAIYTRGNESISEV